jgi:hypothetical protein
VFVLVVVFVKEVPLRSGFEDVPGAEMASEVRSGI